MLTSKDLERLQGYDSDLQTLRDGDVLTLPDVLPGWEVAIAELWAPEFD
jgi:Uma2 family endonuclease